MRANSNPSEILPRVWLGCITQDYEADNINELTKDIYQYFDGLIVVDHSKTEVIDNVLLGRLGGGEIIKLPFLCRHDWSMNAILYSKPVGIGDYIVIRDSAERISVDFAAIIKDFCHKFLVPNNVAVAVLHSKAVIVRYEVGASFRGSPHWGYVLPYTNYCICDLAAAMHDADKHFYSVRNQQRPRDHSIDHFLKYYLYKDSNHLLLGREHDFGQFLAAEAIRQKFLMLLRTKKIDNTPSGLLYYIEHNGLDDDMKVYFNSERILNDWYCYRILRHDYDAIERRRAENRLFDIQ